jgi:protein-S-isoprenylcysteine O-methyltransferase Ste14
MNNMKDPVNEIVIKKPKPGFGSIILGLVSFVGLPLSLFLSAGKWNWKEGWIYIGLTLLSTLVSRVLMAKKNPGLAAERAHSLSAKNVQSWDKWLMPYVAVFGPLFVFIIAGLNERFGWNPQVPLWLELCGIPLVLAGVALATWAMIVNRFFSGTVRIQTERGHQVVSAGPYHFVRHPGYLGGVISYLAMPLILGSVWAYIPTGVGIVVTALRAWLEDNTLQKELPGYLEYTHTTHYRLIPGIW